MWPWFLWYRNKVQHKEKRPVFYDKSFSLPRQLPTFPGRYQPSIISVTELNFRVRDGNGCDLCAIATELLNTILVLSFKYFINSFQFFPWSSPRPISTGQLHTLLHLHLRPINLVVFKGSYYLSMGYLISRGASRLDAFSVYPFRT